MQSGKSRMSKNGRLLGRSGPDMFIKSYKWREGSKKRRVRGAD